MHKSIMIIINFGLLTNSSKHNGKNRKDVIRIQSSSRIPPIEVWSIVVDCHKNALKAKLERKIQRINCMNFWDSYT